MVADDDGDGIRARLVKKPIATAEDNGAISRRNGPCGKMPGKVCCPVTTCDSSCGVQNQRLVGDDPYTHRPVLGPMC